MRRPLPCMKTCPPCLPIKFQDLQIPVYLPRLEMPDMCTKAAETINPWPAFGRNFHRATGNSRGSSMGDTLNCITKLVRVQVVIFYLRQCSYKYNDKRIPVLRTSCASTECNGYDSPKLRLCTQVLHPFSRKRWASSGMNLILGQP